MLMIASCKNQSQGGGLMRRAGGKILNQFDMSPNTELYSNEKVILQIFVSQEMEMVLLMPQN